MSFYSLQEVKPKGTKNSRKKKKRFKTQKMRIINALKMEGNLLLILHFCKEKKLNKLCPKFQLKEIPCRNRQLEN